MKTIRKPTKPKKPELLSIERFAEKRFRKYFEAFTTEGQTLTDFVDNIKKNLGQSDTDKIIFDESNGRYKYTSKPAPQFSTIRVTDELKQMYNKYCQEHEAKLSRHKIDMETYKTALEIWKVQMISKIKGM